MDSEKAIQHIEDYLVRKLKLDVAEASIYYYLLRRSRLIDQHGMIVSVAQLM
ncbi:MAG: hypothetical protein HQ475_08820 [SAR202 cluster bacterium]|nr:hypothetical protein [SAR202 cluster bacterium]